MTCVIIDYGSGNLHSALKSFERASNESGLNKSITLSNNPDDIAKADHIVLPGVGAYADCLSGLEAIHGLKDALEEAVIEKGRPFFGICVGMQLMSTEGHEYKISKGLNWIPGLVEAIEPKDKLLKIPHMGWNTLSVRPFSCPPATGADTHPVLKDIKTGEDGLHAYFVHSYHFIPDNPAHILATTEYGGEITAMVARDNMIGTQFHPEKSQTLGIKLISNFLQWKP
ncbi:MAG: imidazole glycerol phosphate synthase subunit HisH [Hyphomicrobiales bacterium]